MIKKANVEIGFRNKKIKAHKNEHHNLYEELKVMEEVLHQREEELCTQLATMENVQKQK